MEQLGIEYLANALWQLPLLAGGAWLLLRMWNPRPAAQHRIWLAVLALALLMPLRGVATVVLQHIAPTSSPTPAITSLSSSAMVLSPALDSSSAVAPAPVNFNTRNAESTKDWWKFAIASQPIHLNATVLNWILGLWLATALVGLFRLFLAWTAARRLARTSREAVLAGRETAALLQCATRLGIKIPRVHESAHISGPVVVGVARPVLLWPKHFARRSDNELIAALCHEMAHIRRRDYAVNLLCEAASLPLKWHPAIYRVERRIRATREMACDAMAAQAMESETAYATCLVSLARSIAGVPTERSLAAGLFNGNVMEERVMRLMQTNTGMSWRTRVFRGVAAAFAMSAAIALAGAFHVVPAMAQTDASQQVKSRVAEGVRGGVSDGVQQQGVRTGVKHGVRTGIVAPKVKVIAPIVRVAPVVKTTVKIATIQPIVNIAAVKPDVHVSRIVVHVAPVNPLIQVAPAAPSTPPSTPSNPVAPPEQSRQTPQAPLPAPGQQDHAHHAQNQGDSIIICNGRQLTPAERARLEKQLEDAQKRIAAATAKINSPEFRMQIDDAERKALHAETMLNSAQFKQQMADSQKQLAATMAKLNSPEFRKQMQAEIDAATKINSEAFQKQIGDAQAAALKAQTLINSEQFRQEMANAQKQIAAATAQINSPEFKKQIEDEVRAAQAINSAQIQKQMADAQKQIADAMAKMKADRKTNAPK